MTLQEDLRKHVEAGLITERKHPDYNLYVYNYTAKVQYKRLWDELTLQARGLILDENGRVVARPFPKFFNLEEHKQLNMKPIPDEPFEVFDKMDGSLGIAYLTPDGEWSIATRGSFDSPQALKAQEMLKKYPTCFMEPLFTYLFEIVYPENRIVVNYGDDEKLVLLDRIHITSGKSWGVDNLGDAGFDVVKQYDGVKNFSTLREKFDGENKEGFVIKFEGGMRVKMKFQEYVNLHRIIATATPLHVWEVLSAGGKMSDLLDQMPDELYDEVKAMGQKLNDQYNKIATECVFWMNGFKKMVALTPSVEYTRKEAAHFIKMQKHPDVLFKMLDCKEYSDLIWKKIRPRGDA